MEDFLSRHSLELKNVLSFRSCMSQIESANRMNDMIQYAKDRGANPTGFTTTATHGVINQDCVDLEIMVPLDIKIDHSDEYSFIDSFKIDNCIKIRHEGHPELFQEKAMDLQNYIVANAIKVVSVGYTVIVKSAYSPEEIEDMITEFYLPVE